MISLNRHDIRRIIISEISARSLKKLPLEFYGPLEEAIYNSSFWTYENSVDDAYFNRVAR